MLATCKTRSGGPPSGMESKSTGPAGLLRSGRERVVTTRLVSRRLGVNISTLPESYKARVAKLPQGVNGR